MQGKVNASTSTRSLADDPSKNVVMLVNEFYEEYADALDKLSRRLGRPLYGIMLIDKAVRARKHTEQNRFKEIVCDFDDDSALLRALKPYRDNLLAVACSSERSQPDFRRVLAHVPYVLGPTQRSLEWSTHKAKMRELLASYDQALVPKVQLVKSGTNEEIRAVLSNLTFPMIVKPTGLSASVLVTKVMNEDALRTALHKSFAVIHDIYKRDRGRGQPSMLVEEFMEGDMYTVDAYVNQHGKVWTLPLIRSKNAYQMGLEGFYVYEEDNYNELKPEESAAGYQAATKAVLALGLRSCVAHIEMYYTADGWKIIELGPRPGGQRQYMYYVGFGIDHAYNELLVKVGLEPEIPTKAVTYDVDVTIYADTEGVITQIDGVAAVKNHPSVYNVELNVAPGDIALSSVNGGKPIADVIVHNNNYNELRKDIAFVRSTVKIKTDQR